MAAVSVRVLTGEIWAEVTERLLLNRDKHDSVEFLNAALDIASGCLARHIGESIANDEEMPVEPLPRLHAPDDL